MSALEGRSAPPSRVVDAEHRGWWLMGGGTPGGQPGYATSGGPYRSEDLLTYDELNERTGPLRPVEPITDADLAELERLLALAGRKAVYSLAVAVYRTIGRLRDDAGGFELGDSERNHLSHEVSVQQIRAGRAGSWEAELLVDVALWAGHGKPSRIHEEACAGMTAVLYRWCTDPARFTEVAETLAAVVSRYADEHGGWRTVADQWLQPGALDQEGVRLTYGLFYSLGISFDSAALG